MKAIKACHILATMIATTMAITATSCFTGVESTPQITSNDVKRQKITTTREDTLLSSVAPTHPSKWLSGKRFVVTDDRFALVLMPGSKSVPSLNGREIAFIDRQVTPDITGNASTIFTFTLPDDTTARLMYRVARDVDSVAGFTSSDIPFVVDTDIVSQASKILKGNTYYITNSHWYDVDSRKAITNIHRQIPVRVTDVVPGTSEHPLFVQFVVIDTVSVQEPPYIGGVFVGLDNQKTSTRRFGKLFSISNPRSRYPQIEEKTWQHIIRSEIATGMTRDECRLALGSPNSVIHSDTNNGPYERWTYDDGVYLIFHDGILEGFRK